jgi:SOS response regulatory protein OraA/RecX
VKGAKEVKEAKEAEEAKIVSFIIAPGFSQGMANQAYLALATT